MIDDLISRWRELRNLRSTRMSIDQITEQFELAQALTHHFDRALYDQLQVHRRRCLRHLRDATLAEAMPQVFAGTRYNVMSPAKLTRRVAWYQIELTPDITFTVSDQLVGRVLPASDTKRLKDLIKTQVKRLTKEIP